MTGEAGGRGNGNARGRATVRSIERESVRLALEHGAAALTVDQICEAVGISQRSFFHHFDTKEDALLGWDAPEVDEVRVREYLADPSVGILTGAFGLVKAPRDSLEEPGLARDRMRVLAETPSLMLRQGARFRPAAEAVTEVVLTKLRGVAPADSDPQRLAAAASTVTAMVAAVLMQPGPGRPLLPDPSRARSRIDDLRWIWDRLI